MPSRTLRVVTAACLGALALPAAATAAKPGADLYAPYPQPEKNRERQAELWVFSALAGQDANSVITTGDIKRGTALPSSQTGVHATGQLEREEALAIRRAAQAVERGAEGDQAEATVGVSDGPLRRAGVAGASDPASGPGAAGLAVAAGALGLGAAGAAMRKGRAGR